MKESKKGKNYRVRYYFEGTFYDNRKILNIKKYTITKKLKRANGYIKYGVTKTGKRYYKEIVVTGSKREYEKLFNKFKNKKENKTTVTLRTGKVRGVWNKRKNRFSIAHSKFRIQNIGKKNRIEVNKKLIDQWTKYQDVLRIIDEDDSGLLSDSPEILKKKGKKK